MEWGKSAASSQIRLAAVCAGRVEQFSGELMAADIIQFKKPSASEKARGKTLCRRGFHKWVIAQDKQFDSQQGRLITVYRCRRCGASKTKAH